MPVEACSGLWRSEDMVLLSLQMQREVAHDAVLKLGEIGQFQFQDLNKDQSAFQRDFVQEVRRCDDMERKLRFLQDEIAKAGVTSATTAATSTSTTTAAAATVGDGSGGAEGETMFSLEQKVDERYNEVVELNEQYQALIEERNRSKEHLEILGRDFAIGAGSMSNASSGRASGYGGAAAGGGLFMLTGVLPKERLSTFERLVYRTTRGNSLLRSEDIDTPFYSTTTNEAVYKCVFAIYYSAPRLREKLTKLCEVNGATLYAYAESEAQARDMRASLQQQVDTVTRTLRQSALRQRQVLLSMATACHEWRRAVVTEKAVFATMNLLRFSGATAVAQGWAPVRAYEDIRAAIAEAEYTSGAQVRTIFEQLHTTQTPPTYFKTNKITSSFQGIVDSYGMARYKEANPGVFTIITFPYLFGIMYGDVGHGLILTLVAAYLVFREKSFEGQPLNEIFAMIFGGRYLLLLMGLFAVYMGLLYNDMFGFSIELFASGYRWPQLPPDGPKGVVHPSSPNGRPSVKPDRPVVFGIDSAWAETENKLEFYNSIKMKCSVIVGVAQMLAGVFISLTNYLYFNDRLKVWFRFVPECIFLLCTFGYMCLLIIVKWLTTWENTHYAPSLLETMTNFFLAPGTVNLPLFRGQAALQVVLLLIAVACVPCMLIVIPYVEKRRHDAKVRARRAGLLTHPSQRPPAPPHGGSASYTTAQNVTVVDADESYNETSAASAGTTTRAADTHKAADAHAVGAAAATSSSRPSDAGVHVMDMDTDDGAYDDETEDEPFELSEVIIHQIIHTIEYVLGCVSNTASYLRLWALSLAHSQLSEVFWSFAFLLTVGLDGGSGILVFVGFAVWMAATLGVLLGMEALSAFLHALRLHWVEFNNKFYAADGYPFEPFDLADALNKLR